MIQIAAIIDIAVAAGREILEVYGSADFGVETKADDSPLTRADRTSHELINSRLGAEYPEVPVLSEEGRSIPYEERSRWERFWLVDPLDGTKEFVKRNGEFTVNIALIERGRPVAGVVHVPAKDTVYFANVDTGAFRFVGASTVAGSDIVRRAQKLPLAAAAAPDGGAVRVVASRSHFSDETRDYVEALEKRGPVEIVNVGSALKFCVVAEGSAEVYPRFGPTMEWDTGAGQAVAEAAGCTVLRSDTGAPLTYNKRDLVNPWFVVTAGGRS
jgi:3'(2'), 5'-bisphosphate nucleotidase